MKMQPAKRGKNDRTKHGQLKAWRYVHLFLVFCLIEFEAIKISGRINFMRLFSSIKLWHQYYLFSYRETMAPALNGASLKISRMQRELMHMPVNVNSTKPRLITTIKGKSPQYNGCGK
jgi:hypothetical protein